MWHVSNRDFKKQSDFLNSSMCFCSQLYSILVGTGIKSKSVEVKKKYYNIGTDNKWVV